MDERKFRIIERNGRFWPQQWIYDGLVGIHRWLYCNKFVKRPWWKHDLMKTYSFKSPELAERWIISKYKTNVVKEFTIEA